ncbi:MAG: L,D-transpeptidase [Planctomycetes bacterium]|nr:L,D-transpeptidase [Planctomycetota bacterium]
MDVYIGEEDASVFVCSFKVGLGEFNSTPEVRFRVRPDSKLIDPAWQNPRTGERFASDDPKNPIGERWLGLVPEDDRLASLHVGYGIHGTIEPESIGTQASMGCIRLGAEDVKLVWSMLMESVSSVEIVP